MRGTDLLSINNPKRIIVRRGDEEIESFAHKNRPEREGVYRCVMNDGSEMALELSHVAWCDSEQKWLLSVWCWRLPGFSQCNKVGCPYWQPSWIKDVKEFICDPLPSREWTDSDYLNWQTLTDGRNIH